MSLDAGSRFGSYEVLALLGAGGMGEVYRARDTRLKREVALKILPDALAGDPDRLARFQREAEVLASLNHPNIAAIYGLEESDGIRALVMELVEGETLADRIARSAIPVDEALPIARQIAEALEAAHEQGIIHRDLKPANIKVRPDGTAKVLDFGLAKLAESAGSGQQAAGSALSLSPTITSPALMTGVGVLLGTAAYMAPEQAKGKPADKRSDIWAFGCVLYEMLTGTRAFAGDDVADTLANVLKAAPDWNALPAATPPSLRRLMRRCVEKDGRERLRDIGDARIDLRDAVSPERDSMALAGGTTRSTRAMLVVAGLGAVLGAAAVAAAVWLAPGPAVPRAARLVVSLAGGDRFDPTSGGAVAIAPDGSRIVYAASSGNVTQLFERRLDDFSAVPIAGTEGGGSPFFSPDGQWVAFHSGDGLKKVPISGKGVITICRTPAPLRGGAWAPDDTIYFGLSSGGVLQRVPASGGAAQPATRLAAGELLHRWPQVTADGTTLLFTALTGSAFDTATTVMQRLDTGERRVVFQGGTAARYLETGHLVYVGNEGLFAIPFDLTTLRVAGAPVQIVAGVQASLAQGSTGGAQYAVSRNGTLVYAPGSARASDVSVVWVDRNGRETPAIAERGRYLSVVLSPDDRQAALAIDDAVGPNIWVYDFGAAKMNRLTFDNGSLPMWTADGQRIVYRKVIAGSDANRAELYWRRADGTGSEEAMTTDSQTASHPHTALSSMPNGVLLMTGGGRLARLDLAKRESPLSEIPPVQNARLSSDGKWIAYISTTGELYVQPFPSLSGRWQVSTGTATQPRWRPDGAEIFYWDGPSLMAASVTMRGEAFSTTKPTTLFATAHLNWEVSRDGRRFLVLKQAESDADNAQLNIVLNWTEELKARVSSK